MPNLNHQQVLFLFFVSGLLFGMFNVWGGVGIALAMVLVYYKKIFSLEL